MSGEAAAPAKTRVAVCEDERLIALDIGNFLRREGYELAGLYEAAEDLIAAAAIEPPDLVLMDIHLRGPMDGLEASSLLLERFGIPVILLTAYADAATIERAKRTQPFGYVIKPYDDRELRTAIEIGVYRSGMEKRLRQSEARYRGLFEDSFAALFLADRDGRILEANRAFRRLAGDAASLGDTFADGAKTRAMLASLAAGARVEPESLEVSRPSGEGRYALVSADRVSLPGERDTYLFQAFDVTERKRLQDGMARAQKMEALGRLAGGAAHDFNNIITAVLGYARLARDGLGQDSPVRAELEGIEAAARRATVLARQLLVFSRREKSELGVFSLGELAEELKRMLDRLVGEDVSIHLVAERGNDFVRADKARMEQVIVNLVINAKDAMANGGRIGVMTGPVTLQGPRSGAFGTIPAGDWVCLRVSDEGEGISPENMQRLFEPFFSTKPADKGTGLGLSTVAGIVRQAEGQVEVQTAPGKGSTFSVYLPRSAGRPGAEREVAAVPGERIPGHGETIFVVEDDDAVRSLMESILARSGYRVSAASDPLAALALLREAQPRPQAMVVDMVLPHMKGNELARRARSIAPGLPVLYITGHAELNGTDCLEDPCLAKPFTETELEKALSAILRVPGQ